MPVPALAPPREPTPSPFATPEPATPALGATTAPASTSAMRTSYHPKAESVEATLNGMQHEAARETLRNYFKHLKDNGSDEATAYSKVNTLLESCRNSKGELPWVATDRDDKVYQSINPARVQQDRVHKMVSCGIIPESCVHQVDPDIAKLNPHKFKELTIGAQHQGLVDGQKQRYQAAQDKWNQEKQEKSDMIRRGYVTGAFSDHERIIARQGLKFEANHGLDPEKRASAQRVSARLEQEEESKRPFRRPQSTYIVAPNVAQRLAENPANIAAAEFVEDSSPEYAALRNAAPGTFARNEMPSPEQIEKDVLAAQTRITNAQKRASSLTQSQELLKKEFDAKNPDLADRSQNRLRWNQLNEAKKACQSVTKTEQELVDIVNKLKENDGGGFNPENHGLIRRYNDIVKSRTVDNQRATEAFKNSDIVSKEIEEARGKKPDPEVIAKQTMSSLWKDFSSLRSETNKVTKGAKLDEFSKALKSAIDSGIDPLKMLNEAKLNCKTPTQQENLLAMNKAVLDYQAGATHLEVAYALPKLSTNLLHTFENKNTDTSQFADDITKKIGPERAKLVVEYLEQALEKKSANLSDAERNSRQERFDNFKNFVQESVINPSEPFKITSAAAAPDSTATTQTEQDFSIVRGLAKRFVERRTEMMFAA